MAATRKQILYRSADNLVRVDELKDSASGSFLNAASVTGVLKDSAGLAVPGADAIAFAYVAGSNGRYHGTIESTVVLTLDADYTLEITAAEGVLADFRVVRCVAKDRALK